MKDGVDCGADFLRRGGRMRVKAEPPRRVKCIFLELDQNPLSILKTIYPPQS